MSDNETNLSPKLAEILEKIAGLSLREAADLAKALTTTRHLIDPAAERCSPRTCNAVAQLIRSTGEVWQTASLICMHTRI
jgi:hypothetical protein